MIRPSTNANDTRAILPVFRVSRFTVQDMATSTEEGGDGNGPNGGGGAAQANGGGGYTTATTILTSTGIMYTGGKRERDGGDAPVGNADAEQQHKALAKQLHLQHQNEVMKNRLVKLKKRVEASAGARPVRSAEAVIVMHDHGHPHVLMLRYHTTVMVPQNRGENNNMNNRGGPMRNMRVGQVASIPAVSYTYRLPGGTCRENESEVPCLLRKLGRRLLGYTKEPKNSHLPTGNSEFEEVSAVTQGGSGGGEQAGLQAGVRVPIHDGGGVSIVTQTAAAAGHQGGVADGISGRLSFATPKKIHPTTTTSAAVPSTPPQRPSIVVPEDKVGADGGGDGELQFSLGDSMPSPSQQHVSSPHKPPRGSVGGGGVASTPLGSQIFSAAAATPNNTSAASPSAFAAANAMATTTTTVQPHVTVYSAAAKGASEYFKISQVVGTWFRPAYDKPMYPYCPAHIVKEKESRLLYLVGVEDIEELRFTVNPDAAPKTNTEGQDASVGNSNNRTSSSSQQQGQQRVVGKGGVTSQGTLYDLVAVPLFDLYNNAAKYGTIAESLPHILSRFNMEYNE